MNSAARFGFPLSTSSAFILWTVGMMWSLLGPAEAGKPVFVAERSLFFGHEEDVALFPERRFTAADTLHTDTPGAAADTLQPGGGAEDAPEEIEEEEEPSFSPEDAIPPMKSRVSLGYEEVLGDSLLRWEQWYNLAERQSYSRGVIAYRLGALGRHDARLIRAHQPRHQVYRLEGVPLNDPVTGGMNTNMLPLDRFAYYAERSEGIRYSGNAELVRFYVNKPLTWVNFEETADNERRAEGLLTRNITQRGNLELSFRGNNHDGTYRRSQLSGRQASARYSHYLGENWLAQAYLLYNGQQIQQPGGYEIGDPFTFGFIPLQTPVSVADGRSSMRSTHLGLSLYHRPETDAARQSRIQAYHQRYRRLYSGEGRETFFRVFSYGLRADTRWSNGGLSIEPSASVVHSYENQNEASVLDTDSWTKAGAGLSLKAAPGDFVSLRGWSNAAYRSDDGGTPGYEAGYRLDFRLSERLRIYQSLSFGQVINSIQQRYWDGPQFAGSPELRPEQIARAEAGLSWSGGWLHEAGLRGYVSSISAPVVLSPEADAGGRRPFINIDAYQSLGGEVYAGIKNERIEAGLSATLQQYTSSSSRPENLLLSESGIRNTNRAYFYLKRYFFDFASFAKVGAVATFSPNSFQSSQYYEGLDYWDPLPEPVLVPGYYRVDLEVSGRVRMLMVLLRYENIFDEIGQAGYFETARYPMPGRRFRLGIRWVLRN